MYHIKTSEYIGQKENINIFSYVASQNMREHTHEFIEIVYILSGKGQHYINGICYNVRRGDLLFINFDQSHSIYPQGDMEIANCLISPEFIDRELINSENAFEILALSSFADFNNKVDKLVPFISFNGEALIEIESLIDCMLKEFNGKQTNYRTALKGYILVLLTKIFREMQRTDYGKILLQMNKITPEILNYIEDNYFEKITLKELAKKCFYNPSYFSKVFKDYYGKNLMEFIHEKRIQEAIRLLKETDLSVEAVSYSVGYNNRKQFYKIFRDHLGITPGMVRSELVQPKLNIETSVGDSTPTEAEK